MYTLHTLFCMFGADLCAQSVLLNKISASELSRKFIKSALLVGQWGRDAGGKRGKLPPSPLFFEWWAAWLAGIEIPLPSSFFPPHLYCHSACCCLKERERKRDKFSLYLLLIFPPSSLCLAKDSLERKREREKGEKNLNRHSISFFWKCCFFPPLPYVVVA